MWLRVRTMDGRLTVRIDGVSRRTSVASLKSRVEGAWPWAWSERQRLFFRGKELVDEMALFHFDVGINSVVQVFVEGGESNQPRIQTKPCHVVVERDELLDEIAKKIRRKSEENTTKIDGEIYGEKSKSRRSSDDEIYDEFATKRRKLNSIHDEDFDSGISVSESPTQSEEQASRRTSSRPSTEELGPLGLNSLDKQSTNFDKTKQSDKEDNHSSDLVTQPEKNKNHFATTTKHSSITDEKKESTDNHFLYTDNQKESTDNQYPGNQSTLLSNSLYDNRSPKVKDKLTTFNFKSTTSSNHLAKPLFKVGDLVDARDPVTGGWWEAVVEEIVRDASSSSSSSSSFLANPNLVTVNTSIQHPSGIDTSLQHSLAPDSIGGSSQHPMITDDTPEGVDTPLQYRTPASTPRHEEEEEEEEKEEDDDNDDDFKTPRSSPLPLCRDSANNSVDETEDIFDDATSNQSINQIVSSSHQSDDILLRSSMKTDSLIGRCSEDFGQSSWVGSIADSAKNKMESFVDHNCNGNNKKENNNNIKKENNNNINPKDLSHTLPTNSSDLHPIQSFTTNSIHPLSPSSTPRLCLHDLFQPPKYPLDGFRYLVRYEGKVAKDELSSTSLRPRVGEGERVKKVEDIVLGETVMVNHNLEEPGQLGYWYDGVVTGVLFHNRRRQLIVSLFAGASLSPLHERVVDFISNDVFKISADASGSRRRAAAAQPRLRRTKPQCGYCGDDADRSCRECGCRRCGGKEEEEEQILCDECNDAFHLRCLEERMRPGPSPTAAADNDLDSDWFCPSCRNDAASVVRGSAALTASKRKAAAPSRTRSCSRDWGRGMATAGRTKECTVVAKDHFGPIPGVEVGSSWVYRIQVSEAGVHRPPVSGVSGSSSTGAQSLVLAGGYDDDVDEGDVFVFTGSGGKDLKTGNKRTAPQTFDQTLTGFNLALARNCAAPVDPHKGASALNWRRGKPVRVCRGHKARKYSKFAPKEGFRYDGIYRVTRYWPELSRFGFRVWRFELKRDDASSAPWTTKGNKRIKELGLSMEYPEGWGEKKGSLPTKTSPFHPTATVGAKIAADRHNAASWNEALAAGAASGRRSFLDAVQRLFNCVVCLDLLAKPVRTPCGHLVCRGCLRRAFDAEAFGCPMCRFYLGKEFDGEVDERLGGLLEMFYPGYGKER